MGHDFFRVPFGALLTNSTGGQHVFFYFHRRRKPDA